MPRRRMDEKDRLIAEIAAWEEQRNEAGARINWMFTCPFRPSQSRQPDGAVMRTGVPSKGANGLEPAKSGADHDGARSQ